MRLRFGPFSLRNFGEALYREEEPVRLGSRARQILALLLARAGQVVSKSDLMSEVWPDTTVVENNLTVHVAALRRALGDGRNGVQYIVNVPGRGYCFVAAVRQEREPDAVAASAPVPVPTNLPARLAPAIGLAKAMEDVTAKLRASNLVTVSGPAGVGKTTLALHVAKAQLSRHSDGIWLVDLAPLGEAEHVFAAVATTLRIDLGSADPTTTVLAALSRSSALLVLDNCEHLIDAVADLADMFRRHCSKIVLLATSREPLRVGGEVIYVLAPLETPPDSATIGAAEALTFPAVQLLVERIAAASNDFAFSDGEAVAATAVCRRLDGLPLAIEFAAALVGAFGLAGVAARLDDLFKLMQTGMRGVSLRHRTLTTALDWSYSLLDAAEQATLRRLGVFAGGFTLQQASAIIGISDPGEVGGLLARLHTKSLITSDAASADLRFRLLETTRAFALEKLHETGEFDWLALRHANHFATILDLAWSDKVRLFDEGGYASIGDQIGNVRAALRWSVSAVGKSELAIKLAAGAGLYFVELGLMEEARDWTGRTLDMLGEDQRNTRHEMMLQYAYAYSMVITRGNTDESGRAVTKSIELATLLDDHDLQIRVLGGYHMFLSRSGDNRAAMKVALRAASVANHTKDPEALAMTDAMLCRSYHYAGDQEKAEAHVRSVFECLPLGRKVNTIRFGNDHRGRALACHASILWLVGRPVQARDGVRQFMKFSESLADPIVAVQAGYAASVLALQCGDWDWAEELIGGLTEVAREHAIAPFPALASSLEAELHLRAGAEVANGLVDLQAAFETVRLSRYNPAYHGIALIEALTKVGRDADAKILLDELADEMRQKGQLLYMPEYLRLEGDILAAKDQVDAEKAPSVYRRAIQLAREQSALAWELRATISLARFYRQSDPRRAEAMLVPVYRRYTEGFDTVDLVAAKRLLEELA